MTSPEKRREIISALRKDTVPRRGLDFLAVGLRPFEDTIKSELNDVAEGGAIFKAVRGRKISRLRELCWCQGGSSSHVINKFSSLRVNGA